MYDPHITYATSYKQDQNLQNRRVKKSGQILPHSKPARVAAT